MAVSWNSEAGLWVKDFKKLLQDDLQNNFVTGVNSSSLGVALEAEVPDFFKYHPKKDPFVCFGILGYEPIIISDETTEGRITEINMTVGMRVFPLQYPNARDRAPYQDDLVNLAVNYINNEITSLQTSASTIRWDEWRTGGVTNDLYWDIQGCTGSEIIITCKGLLTGYTT